MLGIQATARSYEETLEEAVEFAEEKVLSDRQPSSQEKDDRDSEELRQRELQAWDEKLELPYSGAHLHEVLGQSSNVSVTLPRSKSDHEPSMSVSQ